MATIMVVDDSPTIRQVVETVLQRGGFDTVAAADGRQALQLLETTAVDMVLLDFVMPVMNGYQFCRHLRADSKFEHLPVVLMSAKGDKIRGQFVQQTGAADAITKPFDPRALIAVVESTLSKPSRESEQAPPLTSGDDEGTLNISQLESIENPADRAEEVRRVFAKSLTRFVYPGLVNNDKTFNIAALEETLKESLSVSALTDLGGILALLDEDDDSQKHVLSGDLSFISIAEVMQMLELQRQTGALNINAGDQAITLFLNDGRIDLAKSRNLPTSFRLGRFLVEDGVISREELAPLLQREDSKHLLGEDLVEHGRASEEQVAKALRRQSSEIVYEAVRWKTGRFNFVTNDGCPEATLANLALAPGGLLMEGFRRVDEWQLIEGSFKFDDVLVSDEVAIERLGEGQELTPQEELVLSTVDGKRTVRQIVDDVDASTFDVCKVLYQFLKSRLVRRKAA